MKSSSANKSFVRLLFENILFWYEMGNVSNMVSAVVFLRIKEKYFSGIMGSFGPVLVIAIVYICFVLWSCKILGEGRVTLYQNKTSFAQLFSEFFGTALSNL